MAPDANDSSGYFEIQTNKRHDLTLKVKKIALTFDDGPHGSLTPKVLEILKKNNLKATFFVLGGLVEKYPEVIKKIAEDGHCIAIHGYTHTPNSKVFATYTQEQVENEISKTTAVLNNVLGDSYKPEYFRPYGLLKNKNIDNAAKKLHLKMVLSNVDPEDWKQSRSVDSSFDKLVSELKSGGTVILFHDIQPKTVTHGLLIKTIQYLTENKYTVVPLKELDKLP
jgi:peptidoglycan-N-acetylglucosamine deacetylase